MSGSFPLASKVLIVGFDAATWKVIDPLLAAGRLPNLAAFRARGSSGIVQSKDYSASPVMWTSLATGKTPAQHGVHDFYARQDQLHAKRLWEILDADDRVVGVYQWLVTWPPHPTRGFIVPGWLAPDTDTHPPELEFITRFKASEQQGRSHPDEYVRFFRQAMKFGLTARTAARAAAYLAWRLTHPPHPLDKYRAQLVDLCLGTDFFCHLLRRYRPDFAAVVYYQADSVGHTHWKYREPERFADAPPELVRRYGDVIDQVYMRMDEALGQIARELDSGWTVLIVSDHGMGPAITPSGHAYRPRLEALLDRWGLLPKGTHSYIGLDFFVRLMGSTPLAQQFQKERLEHLVSLITLSENDEPLFQIVPTDPGYVKLRLRFADPGLTRASVRLPDGTCCSYEDLVITDDRMNGQHEPEGMFILAGPHVRPNQWLGPVELTDFAPTLLALMGQPAARDMEGRVLFEALSEEFLRDRPVQYIDTYEDEPLEAWPTAESLTLSQQLEVENRLRALGYLN